MRRIILITLALLSILYAGDYASVRFRIPPGREPYGTVSVRPYYVVPQKGGKLEFYFVDPYSQTCVKSLFPHFGYTPCWYLSRHARQRIDT